jgi:hypothetical protein
MLLGDAHELKERYGLSPCPSEALGTGLDISATSTGDINNSTNLGLRASLSRRLSLRSRLE